MKDIIKGVPYNNPSLLPIGNYDIDIQQPLEIIVDNTGSYGSKKKGRWSIIHSITLDDGKEITMVDLVTLKKVLDKSGLYPKMKKNEVAALCQLSLTGNELTIRGDIVKVKKSK